MFDEPSSYLDIKQRLKAAEVIRSLLHPDCYIVAVEHDLSVLDYLSDFICCLYGKPSMYGVVTMPYSVREGINIFLDGFIPTENLRFREESLSFKMVETAEEIIADKTRHYSYPAMTKTLGNFKLTVQEGSFTDSEIIVMLGENGTGKTTFVRLLAGDTPDVETDKQTLSVSLKPQTISPKFPGTVRMLLLKQIKAAFMHPQFQTDVLKPMNLDNIIDQEVKTLSGGELQRVAIVLALGKSDNFCRHSKDLRPVLPSLMEIWFIRSTDFPISGKPVSIYLLDEPSRLVLISTLRRSIINNLLTACPQFLGFGTAYHC